MKKSQLRQIIKKVIKEQMSKASQLPKGIAIGSIKSQQQAERYLKSLSAQEKNQLEQMAMSQGNMSNLSPEHQQMFRKNGCGAGRLNEVIAWFFCGFIFLHLLGFRFRITVDGEDMGIVETNPMRGKKKGRSHSPKRHGNNPFDMQDKWINREGKKKTPFDMQDKYINR